MSIELGYLPVTAQTIGYRLDEVNEYYGYDTIGYRVLRRDIETLRHSRAEYLFSRSWSGTLSEFDSIIAYKLKILPVCTPVLRA